MSRGINKVILVGNVGNEPDTKYTQSGTAVTKISLATSSMRKNREGTSQEFTEWHRVVFFGKLGEIAGEYLRKGSQVYVEGELRYGKYTDDAGVERYTTDIIANQMQMLGGRNDGGSDGQQRAQVQRRQSGSGNTVDRQRQAAGNTAPPMDDFADDDLPV